MKDKSEYCTKRAAQSKAVALGLIWINCTGQGNCEVKGMKRKIKLEDAQENEKNYKA